MRWLSLTGQVLGAVGAICTVVYPFERKRGMSGEFRGDEVRTYPDGPPLVSQLLTQSGTRAGLLLIALGFLLQAAGTLLGL